MIEPVHERHWKMQVTVHAQNFKIENVAGLMKVLEKYKLQSKHLCAGLDRIQM
jgi:hypothetical protein